MSHQTGVATFSALTGLSPAQKIIDIGAMKSGHGDAAYTPLLRTGRTEVIGFEPNREECARLNENRQSWETYLPYAIGDGLEHTLHICQAPGMTSLLEPNPAVLDLFHGFPIWGLIRETERIQTRRLDDLPETSGVTYMDLDIQGAELMALQHAEERLRTAVVLHLEVEFLPLYKNQPLFSDVDQFLRARGFVFHKFAPLVSRALQPIVNNNNIMEGLSQLVWADAVFVRDLTRLDLLTDEQLAAMAEILHECYSSVDVAHHALAELDRRSRSGISGRYLGSITRAAA